VHERVWTMGVNHASGGKKKGKRDWPQARRRRRFSPKQKYRKFRRGGSYKDIRGGKVRSSRKKMTISQKYQRTKKKKIPEGPEEIRWEKEKKPTNAAWP